MFLDRFGNELKVGDMIQVDSREAEYSKCKKVAGWKITSFLYHTTVTEVVVQHTSEEYASFPVYAVWKLEHIKKFLNHIAPGAKK